MKEVCVLSVVIFTIVLIEAMPKPIDIDFIEESKLHCDKICSKFGGETSFDPDVLTCTCDLPKTIDDADIALIKKNAKLLNLTIETLQSSSVHNTGKKRVPRNDDILGQRLVPVLTPRRALVGPIKPNAVAPIRTPVVPVAPIVAPVAPIVAPVAPLVAPIAPPRRPLVGPARSAGVGPIRPIQAPLIPSQPSVVIQQNTVPISPVPRPGIAPLPNLRPRTGNIAVNPGIPQPQINSLQVSVGNLSQQMAATRARLANQRKAQLHNFRNAGGGRIVPLRPGFVGSTANNASEPIPPQEHEKQNLENHPFDNIHDHNDSSERIIVPQQAIISQPPEFIDD